MRLRRTGAQYIEDLLAFLRRESPYWKKTSSILLGMGIEVNDKNINNARITLNHLVGRGQVERRGSGKFEWRLTSNSESNREALPSQYLPDEEALASFNKDSGSEGTESVPAVAYGEGSGDILNRVRELESEVQTLDTVRRVQATAIVELEMKASNLEAEVSQLRDEVGTTREIIIKQRKKPDVKMSGIIPDVFERVLALASCRKNILLVGPAGCGKTTIGFKISQALKLRFGAIVCTAGMSENHILGKELQNISDGTSKFRGVDFTTCYEEGGVFLFDEIDAGDPNMLLCVNSALSNGYVNLPGRPKKSRVEKHEDFICIATANTFGRGANRTYAGRNQLDEATVDRFRIGQVECDYDRRVERALCPDEEILNPLWAIRDKIVQSNLRRVLSTRFIADAYDMSINANWGMKEIHEALFVGWTPDEVRKVSA